MNFGAGSIALVQDPAKAKQGLIPRIPWDSKLKTSKAGINFTNNTDVLAHKVVSMTRTGHLMGIRNYDFFVLLWAALAKSQVSSVSGRKGWTVQEPVVSTNKRTSFFQALIDWRR